jgi:hypothetical protein
VALDSPRVTEGSQRVDSSTLTTLIAGLLSGGIAGTIVTTFVSAGRDGRTARAKVRECLADTEDRRWLDADFAEFRKALTRLEAAAIIARFDREMIHRYTYLATVARYQEIREKADSPDLPPRTLPLELAALLEGVVVTISNEAWRPRFWRLRRKRFIWVLDQHIRKRAVEHPDWAWNVTLFRPRFMTKEPGVKAVLKRRMDKLMHQQAAMPEADPFA